MGLFKLSPMCFLQAAMIVWVASVTCLVRFRSRFWLFGFFFPNKTFFLFYSLRKALKKKKSPWEYSSTAVLNCSKCFSITVFWSMRYTAESCWASKRGICQLWNLGSHFHSLLTTSPVFSEALQNRFTSPAFSMNYCTVLSKPRRQVKDSYELLWNWWVSPLCLWSQ